MDLLFDTHTQTNRIEIVYEIEQTQVFGGSRGEEKRTNCFCYRKDRLSNNKNITSIERVRGNYSLVSFFLRFKVDKKL